MSDTGRLIWAPRLCGQEEPADAFWSDSLSLNTSTPDVTVCFQRSVLLWVPCGWLWAASLVYIPLLYSWPSRHGFCSFSRLNLLKTVVAILLVTDTLVSLVLGLTAATLQPVDYIYYTVRCLSMILATVFVRWEFIKGSHSSGFSFIFWLLQFLCDVIIIRSWILRQGTESFDRSQFILFTVYFSLVCLMFLLQLFADKGALRWSDTTQSGEKIPLLSTDRTEGNTNKEAVQLDNKKTLPELYAPFWAKVTFLWLTGDILRGYRKLITFEALYQIRLWERCTWLVPKYYNIYNKGRSEQPISLRDESGQKRTRHSFLWSIFWAGGYILIPGILLNFVSLGFRILQPFILGELITFIESGDPYIWKGILLAVSLFVCGVISTIFIHNYLYCAWLGGIRVRGITNAIIYRKALRLSGSAKKATTVGEILNLMSVDAQKLQDAWTYSNLVWEVPVEVVLCTTMIWTVVGPSALAGVGVLGILMPINGFFAANWIRKLQGTQMEHKDQRVKFLSEILAGIKIIKLYAWEPPFMEKLVNTRARELYYLKLANLVGAISNTFWFLAPYMVSLAVFTTYVLISPSNILDPNKAFVTLSLVNVMNFTIAILPLGISFFGQAIVSVERINKFLEMDELDEGVVQQDASMEDAVSLTDAAFSWEKEGRCILKNIDLHIRPGQLVAVVGHVGSGKTSLMSAILGEMSKQQGDIRIKGSLAYIPQQAWIQNATVRNNVIFGRKFHQSRYYTVLEATALLPDLGILSDGDSTEIGEKGINLSGGQKQRVSLARAVYQDEDIYLLDDPLSAVDAHVGKHIFEKVISNKGLLKHKTRVFVTHGISYLRYVDVVVVMKDGVISEIGNYEQLIEQQGAFAEFLANYFNEALEYSSAEEEDIMAIHSELSAVSGAESGPESKVRGVKRPRKRRTSRGLSTGSDKAERTVSVMSESQPMKLIEDETAEEGNVRGAIIWRYVKAGGKPLFYITLLFQLLFTVTQVLTNLWLSSWSSDQPSVNGTMDADLVKFRVGIYGALGIGQGITATVLLVAGALGCLAASGTLHSDLLYHLLRAPMAFFDTTPLGRIINRCSKDMDIIDTNMPIYLRGLFFALGPVVATVFIISYSTPMFLIACIPIAIIYAIGQRMYIKYVRQLKRIDNIRRSPIYAHFDETISGTDSIRAYRRQTDFTTKCDQLVDESQRPFYLILVAQRWLGVTMETVGSFISFFAALFAVFSRNTLSGGMAGLSVSYALSITTLLNSLIRCMTELETYMVSVERVDEYCHIEQEADWQIPETETDKQWPSEGHIQMEHYGTRYRPGLDLVLKDLTCDIAPGEKVGIVGRTGAGKSSLALALFRIIEAAKGFITIDGVPISRLGLHNLRSRLTVIPQDPVIFSGSLRQNLDPLSEYSEKEVWVAVEKAHLKGFIQSLAEGLDYECGEGGQALSVGQRQLVCLARAILRQTQVLVLDEATAAVDLETDALIQATIKDMFSACTVLTIAHRLVTVIDYDRIMVLDQGNVIEFDSPTRLLAKTDSVFHSLAKEAGLV